MYKHFLFCFLLLLCFALQAQENKIVLEGRYQGKNIYVSNPYAGNGIGFCTKKVLVNGKEISFEDSSSAYEINLNSLDLNIGDSVTIVIKHRDDCTPKVMHMDYGRPRSTFDVKSIEILSEGTLKWTTSGEIGKLPFIIEQFRWNKWVEIGEVEGKGGDRENHYEYKVAFHSGKNQFRVKQVDYSSAPKLSKPVNFVSQMEAPSVSVDNIKRTIEFTSETMYRLYDDKGNVLKLGTGKTIDCSKFKKGIYYIDYDNRTAELLFRWK